MSAGTRRLLWPGLMTAVMLAILLSLGTWQMQRRDWKLALLAAIDSAEAGPAVPLTANPAPFSKVLVEGNIPADLPTALYGAEGRQGKMGAQLLTALRLPQGSTVLVSHGWIATDTTIPPPSGPARIEGYVRPAETAGWTAANDSVATRRFYTLDPAKIAAALGAGPVAPYVIVAIGPGPATPGGPDPVRRLPRPPNDHLSYALTWYGLAAVLAVIFLVYARKAPRA